MKKLSVKMKITLWYTGLIVIILSAIFTAVLLATDKVLLLGVQNKLEEWSDDHGPCGQRSAGNTLCRRAAAEGRK